MAEEKKKPDLRSRLKGTMAGNPPPASAEPAGVAPPAFDADYAPPTGGAPMDAPPVAPPMGGGDDIAVPDFIRQQMAEKAAAGDRAPAEARSAEARAAEQARAAAERQRLAALAADPFSASTSASAQEARLVIDDKHVSDSEVGRKNTGVIVTALAV